MASINGITIKALKKFKDHEGMNIYQGNVYMNGKKLGFWSQDYMSGYDNFNFDENICNEAVEKFRNSDLVDEEYKNFTNLGVLLAYVISLINTEKEYKKYVKRGYEGMIQVTDGFHIFEGACVLYTKVDADDTIKNAFKKQIEEWKSMCFKDKKIKITTYSSLNDFVINV